MCTPSLYIHIIIIIFYPNHNISLKPSTTSFGEFPVLAFACSSRRFLVRGPLGIVGIQQDLYRHPGRWMLLDSSEIWGLKPGYLDIVVMKLLPMGFPAPSEDLVFGPTLCSTYDNIIASSR